MGMEGAMSQKKEECGREGLPFFLGHGEYYLNVL